MFVVRTSKSWREGFPRFELQGQQPFELICAKKKNETVVQAAGPPAVRRRPPHRHGLSHAGRSAAGPPLPPPPAAPPRGPAAHDSAVEWVEIPGGQRGQLALRHSATGQVCPGVPPAGWAAGWVELLVERDVVSVAARRPTRSEILEIISRHRKWASRYRVRKALACNPYTPHQISRRLLSTLMYQDVR